MFDIVSILTFNIRSAYGMLRFAYLFFLENWFMYCLDILNFFFFVILSFTLLI